jgi:hypothetical protein
VLQKKQVYFYLHTDLCFAFSIVVLCCAMCVCFFFLSVWRFSNLLALTARLDVIDTGVLDTLSTGKSTSTTDSELGEVTTVATTRGRTSNSAGSLERVDSHVVEHLSWATAVGALDLDGDLVASSIGDTDAVLVGETGELVSVLVSDVARLASEGVETTLDDEAVIALDELPNEILRSHFVLLKSL